MHEEKRMFKALKDFHTSTRRFKAGADINPSEIEGPLLIEDRIALGQIAASEPEKPAKAEKPAKFVKPEKTFQE
jgi:hypothetical protein